MLVLLENQEQDMGSHDGAAGPPGIDRRQFLKASAESAFAMAVLPKLDLVAALPTAVIGREGPPPRRTIRTVLRRREDFLELGFDFYNLIMRDSGDGTRLVRLDPSKEAWVVVTFPSQHLLEEAFFESADASTTDPLPGPGSVRATMAGPSRLAFAVPASVVSIPYDASALLTWASWFQQVVPAAQGRVPINQNPTLREPRPWETAIELPYWLILSPSLEPGLWDHARQPKTSGGRTELWHTSLDVTPIQNLLFPALRAVWARDWDAGTGRPENRPYNCAVGTPGFPFKVQSLEPRDRADIVISSAYYRDRTGQAMVPPPLEPERLMLTTLGGWLAAKGEWDTQKTGRSLESWIHRATEGRDHYVRVVRTGFLFPLGHRAVKIEVSERKPSVPTNGSPSRSSAYLRKRVFIAVRQPVRTYGGAPDPFAGRGLPFTSVRLLTSVTPKLDPEASSALPGLGGGIDPKNVFVPSTGGSPYLFEAVGTDHEGRRVPFVTPLVWVDGSAGNAPACDGASVPGSQPGNAPGAGIYSAPTLIQVIGAFNVLSGSPVRPDIATGGLPAALASTTGGATGATTFDLASIRLLAGPPLDPSQANLDALFEMSEPPFYPVLEEASVRIDAAEVVSGTPGGWRRIRYHQSYALYGYGPGEVFAELIDPHAVSFTKEGRGGGVATPNMNLTGLSRKLGAIGGDVGTVGAGAPPNPCDLLLGTARLLGGISLCDVLDLGSLDDTPVFRTTRPGQDLRRVVLDWEPPLKASGILSPESGSSLALHADYLQDLADPANSTSVVAGDLRRVALTLVPPSVVSNAQFIRIHFSRVAFRSESGRKADVKVDIGDVEFLGALEYLSRLAEVIKPPSGTPTGPFLDVTPDKVTAGLAFALPAVQVGAFVLENISFLSSVFLPLDGTPVSTRFAFSTREDPFHLTVLALGGGGFAAVEIGADGPKALDVSLEAGAMIALNVGVAKGKVEAFAGLYYRLESKGGKTIAVYEAFVRMGGSLRVLGLVTVSSKIYVKLSYDTGSHKYHGSAKLTYSIDVGFFEKDVSFTVHRKFGRDSGDPFLTDRMSGSQWTEYCNAFALQEAS